MVGRADKTIEIIGVAGKSPREVMEALRKAGIFRVHMLARNTTVGRENECWLAIPGKGEVLKEKEVTMDTGVWGFREFDRAPESNKYETGYICWAMGEKKSAPDAGEMTEEESSNSSITSDTSRGSGITEGVIVRRGGNNEFEQFKTVVMEALRKESEERNVLKDMMREVLKGMTGVGIHK